MKSIRWGILSTAKIAREHIIPAIAASDSGEVVAIASRQSGRAQQTAQSFNIPRFYGSYDTLLEDSEVDAVFNPLPNHLHVPWSLKAIQAGKHVLCEKPIAMNATEAQTFQKAAQAQPKLKVMEAFMYRFHPQWQQTKAWVVDGRIGRLCAIQSFFSYFNDDPANIRNKPDSGGGGLMDIGCYCISLSRFIYGEEPKRVVGTMDVDFNLKTDRLTAGLLEFTKGPSSFICSTQCEPYQRVHLIGTQGRIEIEIPFNAPNDRPCRIWLQQNRKIESIEIPATNQYQNEVEAFAQAILTDSEVPTPLSDAVANMKVIDALLLSARTNAWVEC